MSLDLLGADGLSTKFITLRVKHIDAERLKRALGGTAGAAAPLALTVVDLAPELALSTVLPLVVKKAKDAYGVDLEYVVSDAPPPKGQAARSGLGGGVALGLGLAGAGWAVWRFVLGKMS